VRQKEEDTSECKICIPCTNISCLSYHEDSNFYVYQNGISSVQDAAKPKIQILTLDRSCENLRIKILTVTLLLGK